MAKVITVTNQKGGVGKTTCCASICGALTTLGHRVLAIDLDPQGNLGFSLGAVVSDAGYNIYHVMKGETDLHYIVQHTENCDVAPSNIMLAGCEIELNSVGREFILKSQIEMITAEYDYIVIDTPPALTILTINAYTASDQLIIPMVPEILSLQGVSQLKETIFAVKKYFNAHLEVRGILLNRYNSRYILTKEVEDLANVVAEQLKTEVFEQKIMGSVTVSEAPAHGRSIVQYAPKSHSAEEFVDLTCEIIRQPKPERIKEKRGRGRPRKYPVSQQQGNNSFA